MYVKNHPKITVISTKEIVLEIQTRYIFPSNLHLLFTITQHATIPHDRLLGISDNWECPEALNHQRLYEFTIDTIQQLTVKCQHCRSKTDKEEDDSDNIWRRVVVLEGFLLFQTEALLKLLDKKIFLFVDRKTCHDRRMRTSRVSERYFDLVSLYAW
jgi:hypothetical protein